MSTTMTVSVSEEIDAMAFSQVHVLRRTLVETQYASIPLDTVGPSAPVTSRSLGR